MVEPPPTAIDAAAEECGPVYARLGTAGLARLRSRFADLSARIRDRVEDEARRLELKAAAERLNPDGWRTDEEVSAGLESYEATFDTLKTAIGGRRKAAGPAGSAAPEPGGRAETQ